MFPIQLVSVRKSRNGRLSVKFLDQEYDAISERVLNLFRSSIGEKKSSIIEKIRDLELEIGSPKIVKGLSEVSFSSSYFEPPTALDPKIVRETVFSMTGRPIFDPEERKELLARIGERENWDPVEISEGLYGDLDKEQILGNLKLKEPEEVRKEFNYQVFEAIISKCVEVKLHLTDREFLLESLIMSKGLEISKEDGKLVIGISDMLAGKSMKTIKLMSAFKSLFAFDEWEAEATIQLKKKRYSFTFDSSISTFFPRVPEPVLLPAGRYVEKFIPEMGESIFLIIFGEEKLGVYFSDASRVDRDASNSKILKEAGINLECIYHATDKASCPPGHYCFNREFVFSDFLEFLRRKYSGRTLDSYGAKEDDNIIRNTIERLMPDGQAVVEYIAGRGIDVRETLSRLGYSIKWKGAQPVIERN
ncbi:MAG: DUF790 family protein [Candidatus Thermoplasmatota archaeon]|nr:DUF790 family protein [Candidatus Thermoplasmatota archaeon]